MREGEDGLHQPGHPRRRLQVPEVRLHRSDEEGVVRAPPGSEDRADRLHLDRVAEGRPGPVRLEVADRGGGDAGRPESPPEESLLRRGRGNGQPAGRPVVVDRRAADQGEDAVPSGSGDRQPLQDEEGAPLSPDVAVGRAVERLAVAVAGQHPGLLEERGGLRRQDHVDSARERQGALAAPEALGREVDRDERGGAGGVDRHRRAVESEDEADPPGGDAERVPRPDVGVDLGSSGGRARDDPRVVGAVDPDEDPRGRPPEAVRREPRVLERLPGHLEEEPLLRVGHLRLAGRDPEERGVEEVDPGEEGPEPRPAVGGGIPPLLRDLAHRVASLRQELPERPGPLEVGPRSRRKAAADPDDGDRVVAARRLRREDRLPGGDRSAGPLREKDSIEVRRERLHRRVVDRDGRREGDPEEGLQRVLQVDREERVHPRVGETAPGVHLAGRKAEDPRNLLPDDVAQPRRARGAVETPEFLGERGTLFPALPSREAAENRREARDRAGREGGLPRERRPVGVEDREVRGKLVPGREDLLESVEGPGRLEGGHGAWPHAGEVAGHSLARPRPEGEARRRKPFLPAAPGEAVEKGVGRRVGRLPRRAEDGGGRREEDEAGESRRLRRLVEVPRSRDLRRERRRERLRTGPEEDRVGERPGRVNDHVEGRGPRADLLEDPPDVARGGDVGPPGPDRRSRVAQGGDGGARGVRELVDAAAADEDEAPRPPLDQAPRDREAEGAEAACHEDRRVGGKDEPRGGSGEPLEPGDLPDAPRDADLRLPVAGEEVRRDEAESVVSLAGTELHEPAADLGVLQEENLREAPEDRRRQALARHDEELRRLSRPAEKRPERGQDGAGNLRGRPRRISASLRGEEDDARGLPLRASRREHPRGGLRVDAPLTQVEREGLAPGPEDEPAAGPRHRDGRDDGGRLPPHGVEEARVRQGGGSGEGSGQVDPEPLALEDDGRKLHPPRVGAGHQTCEVDRLAAAPGGRRLLEVSRRAGWSGPLVAPREGGEPLAQIGDGRRHDRRPVGEESPSRRGREGDVREPRRGPLRTARREALGPARGEGPQGARTPRRERDDGGEVARRGGGRGRLLEDDVDVRPAEAEGADAREPPATDRKEGKRLAGNLDRHPVDPELRDPRVEPLEVEVRRSGPVAERLHRLQEGGEAGRRLQVPHVRLDGADEERSLPTGGAEDLDEGPHLDRVAERRPGPVRLDHPDLVRRDAGRGERLPDDGGLSRPVRRRQPAAPPVLVHRAAADDGEDAVAALEGVREPAEDDDAAPLSPAEAVRRRVERLAPAVGREHPGPAGEDHRGGRQDDVHASDEGGPALPRPQTLDRQVEGDEPRRAGGVDRHRRPGQAEDVGEAPRRDARGAPDAAVPVLPGGVAVERLQVGVLGRHDPDENARGGPEEVSRGDRGVLQRLPRDLEEEALLRVDLGGLPRSDAEEARVERGDVREEARAPDVHLPGRVRVGVPGRLDVPPVGRDLAERGLAALEKLPERAEVGRAGEAAGSPDDGDRLGVRAPERLELAPRLLQSPDRLRQGREVAHLVERLAHRHGPSRRCPSSSSTTAESSSSDIRPRTSTCRATPGEGGGATARPASRPSLSERACAAASTVG